MTGRRTATMTAEDQIAVTGTLESGAVAALRFRGGSSRATDFHWEINGAEGAPGSPRTSPTRSAATASSTASRNRPAPEHA
ncbi:hypothetical protein [Streptomyces rapamycinicus]|nr:hypothetical protein [Streptomyces rapamycinicus]MBB4783041.1 hypothetical protein [Streptomyces rapamycinicus]UTO63486.1 hypothetical protein LJB45_14895 [Streptomyces rapamycinicus]UTP31443.1 hypothetical protein LIV37_20010 [Streptomyces rapamycinicus NRRL 5491]